MAPRLRRGAQAQGVAEQTEPAPPPPPKRTRQPRRAVQVPPAPPADVRHANGSLETAFAVTLREQQFFFFFGNDLHLNVT